MPRRARGAIARAGIAAVASISALGCGRVGLVLRHPWVEDRTLALDGEVLTLDVRADAIEVDALFRFRPIGAPRDRVMTFPIAAPRGRSEAFTVTLEGGAIEALVPTPADPGALPAGEARETFDTLVPGDALAAHHGELRVRYRQAGRGDFAYTLRTGAYWRGPIGTLDVIVHDPERLVAHAAFDGAAIARVDGGFFLRLVDSEPRAGVALTMR